MSSSGLQAGAATVTERTFTHDSVDVFGDWDQHYKITQTLSNEYKTQQFISDAVKMLPAEGAWQWTTINARGLSAGIAHQGLGLDEFACSYTTGTYMFEYYPLDLFSLKWIRFRDPMTAEDRFPGSFSSVPDYWFSRDPANTYATVAREQEALGGAAFTSEHV